MVHNVGLFGFGQFYLITLLARIYDHFDVYLCADINHQPSATPNPTRTQNLSPHISCSQRLVLKIPQKIIPRWAMCWRPWDATSTWPIWILIIFVLPCLADHHHYPNGYLFNNMMSPSHLVIPGGTMVNFRGFCNPKPIKI